MSCGATLTVVVDRQQMSEKPADDLPRSGSDVIEIDERGTLCPQPIIALGQVSRKYSNRSIRIDLLADDIATKADVPAWCRMTGATLLSTSELPDGSGFRFQIATG